MLHKINTYPVLTEEHLNALGLQIQYSFFYDQDEKKHSLTEEYLDREGKSVLIKDPDGIWIPDQHPLNISLDITFNNPQMLFGEGGVANSKSKLAIGMVWESPDSKQKGAIRLGTPFTIRSKTVHWNVKKITFLENTLRRKVTLMFFLYLHTPGKPAASEMAFISHSGAILGRLGEKNLIIEGRGSYFPIFEQNLPEEPLWHIEADWDDPLCDQYTETFGIYLNTAHENYPLVNKDDESFVQPLLNEIIASALEQLFQKLKEDRLIWEQIEHGIDMEDGSVAAFAHYSMNVLGYDPSSPEELGRSIRLYLDSQLRSKTEKKKNAEVQDNV